MTSLSNILLHTDFRLIVYYAMPQKIEQLLSHIGFVYESHLVRIESKLRQLPDVHFHLMVNQDTYLKAR